MLHRQCSCPQMSDSCAQKGDLCQNMKELKQNPHHRQCCGWASYHIRTVLLTSCRMAFLVAMYYLLAGVTIADCAFACEDKLFSRNMQQHTTLARRYMLMPALSGYRRIGVAKWWIRSSRAFSVRNSSSRCNMLYTFSP